MLRFILVVLLFIIQSRTSLSDLYTIQGTFNTSSPNTLTGASRSYTLSIPKFDPSLGTLNSISVVHSHSVTINAASQAQGGLFIPPDNLDGWVWSARYDVRWSGLGFNTSASGSALEFGSVDSTKSLNTVSVSKTIFLLANTSTFTSPSVLAQFTGNGSVSSTLQLALSTQFPPLNPTPGGFTWGLSKIVAAGINDSATSTLRLDYNYTPVAVPEPTSILLLSSGALSIAFRRMVKRRGASGILSCKKPIRH